MSIWIQHHVNYLLTFIHFNSQLYCYFQSDITRVFRVTRETSTLWAVTGIGAVLGCVITLVSTLTL